MTYDGLGRRIVKVVSNCGDWDATQHVYLDGQRKIELRDGSDNLTKQYVWGTQYVDELVQIGIDVGGQGDCEHFFWALQDAHYNVLAVIGAFGRMVERYEYTPYGRRTVFSHGWLAADADGDGTVDGLDQTAMTSRWGTNPQSAYLGDFNGDGTVDGLDNTILGNEFGENVAPADDPLLTHPALHSYRHYGSPLCNVGHQGLFHQPETGQIDNRARILNPPLGRMNQRDPATYIDGPSLYEYMRSQPGNHWDPHGLWGRDIHFNMTYALAVARQIPCAADIARGCQRPDDMYPAPEHFKQAQIARSVAYWYFLAEHDEE